jgi:hypothetical protein
MVMEKEYDQEDGTVGALYYKGNRKLSNRELEAQAKKMEGISPMSPEFIKNQKESFTLMIMDNRIRKKNGGRSITAQTYLQHQMGGASKCSLKGLTCYFRSMGMMKFVAIGVDKNINVILMGVAGSMNTNKLVKIAKNLNLSAISTGAGGQVSKKVKKVKVYKIDSKKLKMSEKAMKEGLNKLKGLFGN